MKTYSLTQSDHELISMALDVLERNFDDGVYHHTVGGAIRCKNGKVYLGVNCDGIHGSCAEYIAIGAAITAGERDFLQLWPLMIKHIIV
jgi:cytidine deaminase